MAIYDNNGTTNAELGKLYDNNGTTNTQLGKLYDNNGTTSSLLYSAEEYLLQDGVAQTLAGGFTHYAQQYSSTLSFPSGYMQLVNGNSGSQSLVRSNNQIPWGSYSKLYIQMGATTVPSYSNFSFALDKNGTSSTGRWMTSQDTATMSYYKTYNNVTWTEGQVLSFDISSITTSGWFMFGIQNNIGTWKIKNIYVE